MKPRFKRGLNRDDVAQRLRVAPGMPDLHQRISDLERRKLIEVAKHKEQKCHWPLRSGHLGQCYVITKQGLDAHAWATDLDGAGDARWTDPESSQWAAVGDRSGARFAVLHVFAQHTKPQ